MANNASAGVRTAAVAEMAPPVINVQRPSMSTQDSQPNNRFPGTNPDPFYPRVQEQHTAHSSGEASPGAQPSPRPRDIPIATNAPTPLPGGRFPNAQAGPLIHDTVTSEPGPQLRDPAPLAQPAPQNPYMRPAMNVTNSIPDRKSSAAERYTPVNQPTPRPASTANNATKLDRAPRDRSETPTRPTQHPIEDPRITAFKQPGMKQTNRGKPPFMPSPDIRTPSDESLPQHNFNNLYSMTNSNLPSMPNLTIPQRLPQNSPQTQYPASSYVPPTEEIGDSQRQPRSRSPETPAASTTPVHEKRVSFAPKPEFSEAPKSSDLDADANSPDAVRHRRHSHDRDRDRKHRGYEAGDDFSDDTPHEDRRRRSHDRDGERDREREGHRKHSSRRERSNTQSLDRESGTQRDRDKDRPKRSATSSDGGSSRRRRNGSPDSDTTIDLPERFDAHGRRKPGADGRSPEQDLLAESLDKILGGKGLGDVLGTLLGGDDKSGSSERRSGSKSRRH